jgi:WD40 repeat protein
MQNKNNELLRSVKSIKKSDIILFIMDFLHNEHLDKALISLEEETNLSLFNYPKELLVLRNVILEGNWSGAEEILNSINQNNIQNFPIRKAIFEIKKQQFLEAVESEPNQSSNGGDVETLVGQLKVLQTLCEPEEFKKILQCLSQTPSITDQEEYKNWSPITGRLLCFDKIRNYLQIKYPINNNEMKIESNLMINVLKAVYFLSTNDASYREVSNLNDVLKGFIIEVDKDIKENNLQMNINIENDIFKNKINSSTSQINVMKSNRNELILSQSQNQFINNNMKVNNMNELQINKNNNYQNNNHININHLNNEKHSSEENDYSSKNRDTAINMNTNTNNTNTNNEDNANQTQGENNICESSANINLNNNLTLEDYAYIGSGYTKYGKYDISSYDLSEIIEDSHPIRTSCFSPKGDCLAIGTNSKCLKIYSLSHVLSDFKKYIKISSKTKMPLIFEQKNHHMGSIYCLDWSVSGRLLASGSNDKLIKLMVVPELSESTNSKKNEEIDDILELPIEGHNGTVRSLCFDPSSDLTLLTSGDLDKNIKMWDTENGSSKGELVGHTNDVTSIKWSNDGNFFGSGSADKTIKLWDLKSLREICSVPTLGYGSINDISLLNTGEMLIVAAAHVDGKITIWDAQRKSLFTEIKENTQQKEVRGITFSPDGKYLVSGGFDNKVKIYDIMNNFNLTGELEHNDKVVSVKWHPDLPILISTSADKTARLWCPTIY